MAAAKKYRVKVRLKVRNRLLKNTGLAASVVAAAVILGYCGFLAVRLAARMPASRFFAFTVKSLSVHCPSEEMSAEISRRMRVGETFSSAEAAVFAAGLKKSYPALSRVEVKRNFMNGRVSVFAEPESVVAKIRFNGEKTYYLSGNGRLLEEYYGPDPADVFETDVYAAPGLALAPLAGFLKDLKTLVPEFSSRPVKLEYRGPGGTAIGVPARGSAPGNGGLAGSCRLTLENSALVLWGELEFTKTKILRLNEVLPDAARKIKGPLKVDFRYFRDGKVFVSKLTDI